MGKGKIISRKRKIKKKMVEHCTMIVIYQCHKVLLAEFSNVSMNKNHQRCGKLTSIPIAHPQKIRLKSDPPRAYLFNPHLR